MFSIVFQGDDFVNEDGQNVELVSAFGCLRVSDFHKVLDSVYSPFISIIRHYIFCVNAV